MKAQRVILLAVVPLLLVGTLAQAQPGAECAVVEGVMSGGGYRLTALAWQARGTALGGGYRLLTADYPSPSGQGSGCCCVYLPAASRNAP
jgi:hypothetical protein